MTLATTERQVGKTKLRLTSRGKFVVLMLILITLAASLAVVIDATTPAECKVPFEQMSERCKRIAVGI